jgi:hypothetical protein
LRTVDLDDLRAGAPPGVLAATATAGALIAIGMRTTTAARPFNTIASHLLGGSRADVWGFVPEVTIVGIVSHLTMTTMLGIVVATVVRRRLAPLWAAALAATLLSALVSIGVARRGGTSLAQLLPLGDLLLFYVTLAASLVVGMRFAFPPAAIDPRSRRDDM